MKAWEKWYSDEVLDEAKKLENSVKIVSNDGVEIIGEVENRRVTTYIQYNSPTHASCGCSKMSCEHEAALVYYLISHPELYLKNLDFEEIFDLASENDIKRFLLKEMESDEDLKNRFLNEFQPESVIDKNYYRNKLSRVFEGGKGRDFDDHGFYELDMMEDDLEDFIVDDISDILSAGEYDFACELLCEIGELLNDDVMSTFDSWYNLADRFMEHVNVLSTSVYLDAEKMDELNSKIDNVTGRM